MSLSVIFHDGITLKKKIFFEKKLYQGTFLGMLVSTGRFGEASSTPSQGSRFMYKSELYEIVNL